MFVNDWFPKVHLFGISFKDFWDMTIRDINIHAKAFEYEQRMELKNQNLMAYIQGLYFCDALNAVVGNMFAKGRKAKYPKEPYDFFETEKEKAEKQMDTLVEQLLNAQHNFELSKQGE